MSDDDWTTRDVPDGDTLYEDLWRALERHGIGWAVDGVMDSLECAGVLDDEAVSDDRP